MKKIVPWPSNLILIYYRLLLYDISTDLSGREKKGENKTDESGGLNGPSLHYQVFAAVLCFGLLVMLLAVSVVHIKTKNIYNTEI